MTSSPLTLGQRETANPQFRQLQGVHEAFARAVSASLTAYLQAEILAGVAGLASITAGEFLNTLRSPVCLIRMQLHPRAETMILQLDSAAVFRFLELLLGGKGGSAPAEARALTEIEWSLLEEVVRVMVRSLGESWNAFHEVEFQVESLENDPAMVPVTDPGLPLVQIAFTLRCGELDSGFQIAVPQAFFQVAAPVVAAKIETPECGPSQEDLQRNLLLLAEAVVELEVVLDGPTMLFGELAALKTGQVVTFDYSLRKPLRALVNGAIPMPGHVVSSGRKRAFQIEELP